ncbi:hypothetical protein [Sporosarcina sp. NPDC096371]|uniref:hypothetical protein n=1 Tax=Sporosarcina sp. NPDC096371 TaxID=3364530 RepID=UPI0038195999
MRIQLVFEECDLLLKISGWTAVLTQRRNIKIPYTSIENVQVGHFKYPWTAIKKTGIATSSYKAGLFIIDGDKYFLSFNDADNVVTLDLKGFEFDKIVIEIEDRKQLANELLTRCSSIKSVQTNL